MFGFEGAEELWQFWWDGFILDSLLIVSEWVDKHRFLSSCALAELGCYRIDRTFYMRVIMDVLLLLYFVRCIVFMKVV